MLTREVAFTTGVSFLLAALPCGAAEAGGQQRRGGTAQPARNTSRAAGKTRVTTVVDGDTREYYVHVPGGSGRTGPLPAVLMLHGSSGDGLRFYESSGWKELGAAEGVITAYPSSWRHCVVDEGRRTRTTKWNVYPGSVEYCAGEVPKDDVKFLGRVIEELVQKQGADPKRVYVVGFSNGGQMAGRAGVELSDRVAAVVSSGGSLRPGERREPKRLLPNLVQIGNRDDRFFGTTAAPMDLERLIAQSPFVKGMLATYAACYGLDLNYTTGGDPGRVLFLDARGTSGQADNVFRFALVKDLRHAYPNGRNHPLEGARLDWQWLKQYRLP